MAVSVTPSSLIGSDWIKTTGCEKTKQTCLGFFASREVGKSSCSYSASVVKSHSVQLKRRVVMNAIRLLVLSTLLILFLMVQVVFAQAIGEYGRTVGGVAERQGVGQKASRAPSQNSKAVVEGIGDAGGRPVPSAVVVASRQAALYPRQDDETEKIAELSQGDTLIPMGQSNGGNEWYMVKTQKGLVGWIKSADVRTETAKKQ
jgi:hypothetical protein